MLNAIARMPCLHHLESNFERQIFCLNILYTFFRCTTMDFFLFYERNCHEMSKVQFVKFCRISELEWQLQKKNLMTTFSFVWFLSFFSCRGFLFYRHKSHKLRRVDSGLIYYVILAILLITFKPIFQVNWQYVWGILECHA